MNLKEEVDVYKMYGTESTISKEDFFQKYKINQNRTDRKSS